MVLSNGQEVDGKDLVGKRLHVLLFATNFYDCPIFIECTGVVRDYYMSEQLYINEVRDLKSELEPDDESYYKGGGFWFNTRDIRTAEIRS